MKEEKKRKRKRKRIVPYLFLQEFVPQRNKGKPQRWSSRFRDAGSLYQATSPTDAALHPSSSATPPSPGPSRLCDFFLHPPPPPTAAQLRHPSTSIPHQ